MFQFFNETLIHTSDVQFGKAIGFDVESIEFDSWRSITKFFKNQFSIRRPFNREMLTT